MEENGRIRLKQVRRILLFSSKKMHNKLIVPVALGLSLVTVTAFVVYYVFKKDEEEEEVKKVKTARMNVIEVSVPKAIVAGLIGRGGSNIKDIEKISGAKVNVKEFSDKDHDICVIRGRTDATQIAETLVHEFINQQPVNIEDTMEVPSWACGRIIGSQGENINSISHRSGARIKISSSGDKTTVRKVMFLGTEEQIKVARDLIENCVAQEKCRREIEQSKRSPRHVPSSSKSPSPTPSASANETTDGASGDSQVQRHVKSKRPVVLSPAIENRGAPIEVFVSAVSSPSRFWVQFVGPQVTQLDLLVEEMTEYYGKKENRENHALSHVSVGQVVAAVFRHDGRWYRARVHDIRPNEYDHTQQAMECFLAGVRPPNNRETWDTDAIERFETLVHVARWQPLLSKTCTYKKTATAEGEKEREIPGIKLYDNTDNGEYDIGEMLVMEGHADEDPGDKPAAAPNRPPFGDLGSSKVLGMVDGGRSSSVPKDHKDNHDNANDNHDNKDKEGNVEKGSLDTLVPSSPILSKSPLDEFKANMNRIDSHHSNLEFLAKAQQDNK
ncbi:hypothetical protein SFRURICE_018443 [Spodoptera frugiperda]|nr:hypothetical protein SFRURICE_018443 [Spodoptera frugiperda]